jgi:hypothetical protein
VAEASSKRVVAGASVSVSAVHVVEPAGARSTCHVVTPVAVSIHRSVTRPGAAVAVRYSGIETVAPTVAADTSAPTRPSRSPRAHDRSGACPARRG